MYILIKKFVEHRHARKAGSSRYLVTLEVLFAM